MKFKVIKEILAQAAENPRPYSENCPIVRAVREEYPDAYSDGYYMKTGMQFLVLPNSAQEYVITFDNIANKYKASKFNSEIFKEEVLALPEFEFEIEGI